MATSTGSILIVDDDPDILTAGRLLLKRHYRQVDVCRDPTQIPGLMAQTDYATILLDMNFGPGHSDGSEGFYWLSRILAREPDAVVVLITAHGGIDIAVEAMKHGAIDFIAKPWENERVVATLSASVKLWQSRSRARSLQQVNTALIEAAQNSQPMLGTSRAMQAVQSVIERIGPTEANVLILGENGTGKELVARALHRASTRASRVFMSVDLGSITESVFESELFGHVKGAFTDAHKDRVGRIEAASGGTLFLDEVGNLPLHLQAKLLSVLAQRKVQAVGGTKAIDIDVRVIAATNLPRAQLQDDSVFRQDLLFRLNTVEIELAPLRERSEDVPAIAEHYALHYARKYNREPKQFSPAALTALSTYPWPGNVRALQHAVERAVILSSGERFEAADFQIEKEPERLLEGDLNLDRIERYTIQQALKRHRYNISHAAKELGLTRAALYRRMEKHGL